MLNEARADMVMAPHVALFPAIAIFLTVLAFNLLGDGLRDALDPKIKGRGYSPVALSLTGATIGADECSFVTRIRRVSAAIRG